MKQNESGTSQAPGRHPSRRSSVRVVAPQVAQAVHGVEISCDAIQRPSRSARKRGTARSDFLAADGSLVLLTRATPERTGVGTP